MNVINSPQELKRSESGMVAIMVTLIMMVVISLIVIGFAQVTARAQRNALDAQLSTQAFYAAESGVNDTVALMQQQAAIGPIPAKTSCDDTAVYNFNATGKSKIDSPTSGVSYTCVLVDPTPGDLTAKIGANASQVLKLKSTSGVALSKVTIQWTPGGDVNDPVSNCPAAAGSYSVAAGAGQWNCKFGVLRTELTPAAGTLTRSGLIDNTQVFFLGPVRAGGAGAVNWATDNAKSLAATCSQTVCSATISFGAAGVNSYYLHLNTIYQPTTVTVSAKDVSNNDVKFSDAQAQVNVTGKAQDVLRRILVAVPLDGGNMSSPTAAIVSGDTVCKRFLVANGYFSTESFSGAPNNPLCEDTLEIGSPSP